ncbi:MAG: outer membrane beta-barrel protein [Terracidiphilus sp.]|nr:outer membrane beta-barrel protein [Terracidiphilus sp.]
MSFVHNFRFGQTQRTGIKFQASVLFALLVPALLLASAGIARAQTIPEGNRGELHLSAGATGSFDTIRYGSRQMYGVGAFVDAETTGHFGLEAEGRWIEFPSQNDNVHAEIYSVGGRYHFVLTNHWQPYAKALIGFGRFNYAYNLGQDNDLVVTAGGGMEFRASRRIYFRVVDFEYQDWPQAHYGNLIPFNIGAGLKVRIF